MTVEVPDLCPRFTARAFTGVEIGPSPLWLKQRLIAAGQRPISNVVDITNYVMLLTAQPLHAFDLDKVPGGELIVRTAREGEKMTTLDGVERTLDAETVLVCDREQATGIAGIMGGQVSEVSGETTRVLLEVANWNGMNILRTEGDAGPPLGGLDPLREAASSRDDRSGRSASPRACCARSPARAHGAGDDRRGRRDPGPARRLDARRPARLAAGHRGSPRARRRASGGAGVRGRDRGRGGPRRHGPAAPPLRRDARGRPDRGGRASGGLRPPAAPAARGARAGRAPYPRAAAAPPRRGRAVRPGLRRDRRLALRLVRPWPTSCGCAADDPPP